MCHSCLRAIPSGHLWCKMFQDCPETTTTNKLLNTRLLKLQIREKEKQHFMHCEVRAQCKSSWCNCISKKFNEIMHNCPTNYSKGPQTILHHMVCRKSTTLYLITGKIPDTIYLTENSRHIVRIIKIIIHSKYFPVSDWLKPHA